MKHAYFYLPLILLLSACGQKAEEAKTEPVRPREAMQMTRIVGIATIEPLERLRTLNAEVSGVITEVLVRDGQHVVRGETLLTLDNQVEGAQLDQARSRLGTQKAAVAAAKSVMETREIQWKKAVADGQRDAKLAEGNALSRQALENSQFQANQNLMLMQEAAAALAQQEARLRETEADIRYYQTLMGRRAVRSPMAGTFLSVNVRTGSYLNNTTDLGDFSPDGPLIAITEVDELFAGSVQTGLKAHIRNQGDDGVLAKGRVVFVGDYLKKKSLFSGKPDDLEDRRVREVRVELEEGSGVLIGSRVECVISLK